MTLPFADIHNLTEPAWYCVRSQPRRDHIAAANLRRHHQLQVFTPHVRFRRSTQRGPIWVTEPLFPNYLFTRFDRESMLADVRHTFGVAVLMDFLGKQTLVELDTNSVAAGSAWVDPRAALAVR